MSGRDPQVTTEQRAVAKARRYASNYGDRRYASDGIVIFLSMNEGSRVSVAHLHYLARADGTGAPTRHVLAQVRGTTILWRADTCEVLTLEERP